MKLGYSPYAPTPITAQEFSEFITGSIKIGNLGTPVGFDDNHLEFNACILGSIAGQLNVRRLVITSCSEEIDPIGSFILLDTSNIEKQVAYDAQYSPRGSFDPAVRAKVLNRAIKQGMSGIIDERRDSWFGVPATSRLMSRLMLHTNTLVEAVATLSIDRS